MSVLDDLLDSGNPRDRRRGPVARAWKPVAAALALAVAAGVVLYAAGFQVWYPLLGLAACGAVVLYRIASGLGGEQPAPAGPWQPPARRRDPDGLVPAVYRWQTRLRDPAGLWHSRRSLQPHLAALVDGRLRQRYQLTLDSDPERARALLGDRLTDYLEGSDTRPPPPRELAAMISILEGL